MKTFEEQQQMLDEFFEQIIAQTKAFVEQNELIPLGRRYEFSVSVRRRRTGINLTTKKKMSTVPRWKMTNELPSDQDWEQIFALPQLDPAIYGPGTGPSFLKETLEEVKKANSGNGTYIRYGSGYVSKINKILEEANSEFRLFSRGSEQYILRRIQ